MNFQYDLAQLLSFIMGIVLSVLVYYVIKQKTCVCYSEKYLNYLETN
jgi:hypothetical protein